MTELETTWSETFLDALASLDFKLSVTQSLSDSPFSSIKASASTGLSELFVSNLLSYQFDQNAPTNIFHMSTCWRIREL